MTDEDAELFGRLQLELGFSAEQAEMIMGVRPVPDGLSAVELDLLIAGQKWLQARLLEINAELRARIEAMEAEPIAELARRN